ncbi:hypothetical protein LIN78_11670 [Leeia sp. TBRC 13508]|uniref:Uncharacterized protein n=1 Tax=Leeia speluncae TaxID=2884804 RepID=A0ABS8D7P0_9NEIS|nr:hypothetical protein [Leeia speluncae]MCB6184204.1 hypothetical protein [Leeia speluncae]
MSHFTNALTVHISKNETQLFLANHTSEAAVGTLAIGFENVLPGPIRVTPPRPIDLELAIEYIEEEVMPWAQKLPAQPYLCLVGNEEVVNVITALFDQDASKPYSIDQIEDAFRRLCEIAEGSPAKGNESLITPVAVSTLLILREMMHHIGFNELQLYR